MGVELARELLARCKTMANGVYLMPSFGRYENCLDVLEGSLDPARKRDARADGDGKAATSGRKARR